MKVMPITVLLAAQNTLANDALSLLFNQRPKQFRVVGCTPTRKGLLQQVKRHKPDVALVGANLENNPAGVLRDLRELRSAHPSTRTIVISECVDSEQVVEAFAHGARGVFCSREDFPALCECIRRVHAGEIWADSTQLRWVVHALENRGKLRMVDAKGARLLTKPEERIVRMVAEGLPNRKMCAALALDSRTVQNRLSSIYHKLGISSRAELLLYALGNWDAARGGRGRSQRS